MLCGESKKNNDATLVIEKKTNRDENQTYSFYDEQQEYVIMVKDFTVSKNGLLSMTVPFDDGFDYKVDVAMRDLEKMASKKQDKNIVALARDTFYR